MSSTSSTTKLAVPVPTAPTASTPLIPAGHRPRQNANQFALINMFSAPRRIIFPPSSATAQEQMVARLGSSKTTPLSQVKLDDVLANKYLSPLSLKDFEGTLVFREHSAENLYFVLWLNEYTREWNAWMKGNNEKQIAVELPTVNDNSDPLASRSTSHLPDHLAKSLEIGLASFFVPNAPLELNLSSTDREKTLIQAGTTGSPADFNIAAQVTRFSLERSLLKHNRSTLTNAGPQRLAFCFTAGCIVFLLGLLPAFIAIFGHHHRALRLIGLPFLCLGTAVVTMAPRRICAAVWFLSTTGDRQLLPWESAPPSIISSSLIPITSPTLSSSSPPSTPKLSSTYDEEKEMDDGSFASATSASPFPWENYSTSSSSSGSSIRPPSYRSNQPTPFTNEKPTFFAPVVKIESLEVAHEHWRIVNQGFKIGTMVMVVLGAVLLAVPNAP